MYKPKQGDIQMNSEFGRRLRSFLMKGTWWDIAQLAKSDLGDDIWEVMAAGCPDMTSNDFAFARSIDWTVPWKQIELSNVKDYDDEYSNWFYAALVTGPAPDLGGETVITGEVTVQLNTAISEGEAEKRAQEFVWAILKDAGIKQIKGVDATDVSTAKDGTKYSVTGTVYLA